MVGPDTQKCFRIRQRYGLDRRRRDELECHFLFLSETIGQTTDPRARHPVRIAIKIIMLCYGAGIPTGIVGMAEGFGWIGLVSNALVSLGMIALIYVVFAGSRDLTWMTPVEEQPNEPKIYPPEVFLRIKFGLLASLLLMGVVFALMYRSDGFSLFETLTAARFALAIWLYFGIPIVVLNALWRAHLALKGVILGYKYRMFIPQRLVDERIEHLRKWRDKQAAKQTS